MGLKEYKAKRNFNRTAEPSGQRLAKRQAEGHSFVIQKHDASHLHYDFRMEMEGVLKSWAVPKGFPSKRGDRRLAVEVEDHPLEYGGFEGTIAEGNYGAGTVMLWDRGTYQVLSAEPTEALASGKIHFLLSGKKLRGEWTLVRMRQEQSGKPQWLLLKTGDDLKPISSRAENQSILSGRTMLQIAEAKRGREWVSNRAATRRTTPSRVKPWESGRKNRDIRGPAGSREERSKSKRTSAQSIAARFLGSNQLDALPPAQPGFVEPMKALLVSELPKGSQWSYELKFDGVRAIAVKSGAVVDLISRSGKDLGEKYAKAVKALETIPAKDVVLDGELVAVDEQGRSSFQLLQSYQSVVKKPPLLYYVFDIIELEGKNLMALPLWQRKAIAAELVHDVSPMIRFSSDIQADSQKVIKAMQARGLEGLVAKRKDSTYESGRRSGGWVKYKWTNEQEFVIGGFTKPKGARSHFGALLIGYYEGKELRFAAKVGTGFGHSTLESLYQKLQKRVQSDCPFVNLPERGSPSGLSVAEMKRCTWVRPELVCQVRFAEWTRDHHLRQPAFLGLREDKKPHEVVREIPS